VWKLDRLGRSLKEMMTIIDELHQKKIGFKILAGHGAQIDTTTPNGRLVFGVFAALAEFERDLIIERTNAGVNSDGSLKAAGAKLFESFSKSNFDKDVQNKA
jgi:DNA invertase Pin-like site-specific DNA recombinase